MASLADHFRVNGDKDDTGENLIFNTRLLGSIPLRSASSPPLKQDEYDELEIRPIAKVKTFDLSNKEHLEEYELVLHRIVNGWYVKLKDYHHFDPEKKSMIVYLEWCQLYKEIPSYMENLIREEVRYAGQQY